MLNLHHIAFEITDRCNLDCVYCYNIWKMPEGRRIPFNSYRKAIATLDKIFTMADIRSVAFTGGEPFLSERFSEVALHCRMAGKQVTLITNGTQGREKEYRQLIRLGVGLFELPVHSARFEIHDAMANVKGSWEKSTAAIRTIQALGGSVVAVMVITRHNVRQMRETLDFIASLGCHRVMLNRYNIGGKGCANPMEVSATAAELREAFAIADLLATELGLYLTANVCSPVCLLNPDNYPNIGFGHCSANVLYRPITLDINGNIRLCNHSPVVAGNIYETPLEDILYSDYAASWTTSVPELCKPFVHWSACMGGCRAASEQCFGTLDKEDPVIRYAF